MTAIYPIEDLPMFWQGRANALRILVSESERAPLASDATLRQAETYEECAKELRAAMAARAK